MFIRQMIQSITNAEKLQHLIGINTSMKKTDTFIFKDVESRIIKMASALFIQIYQDVARVTKKENLMWMSFSL